MFNARHLSCPVHRGAVEVGEDGLCPVCDTDLTALVTWRLHAAALYERAARSCAAGQWAAADALLEEAVSLAPDLAPDAELLRARSREPRRPSAVRLVSWSAAFALVGLLALGGYRLGQLRALDSDGRAVAEALPSPLVAALAEPAAPPPATPEAQAAEPPPAPTPTAPLPAAPPCATAAPPTPTLAPECVDLLSRASAAWFREPTLAYAALQVQIDGCRVVLTGTSPTRHLVNLAASVLTSAEPRAVVDASGVRVLPEYVVRPGDTLWLIGERLYGQPLVWREILARNAPLEARLLQVGQTLALPEVP